MPSFSLFFLPPLSAGASSVVVGHPLDTVKVFQSRPTDSKRDHCRGPNYSLAAALIVA